MALSDWEVCWRRNPPNRSPKKRRFEWYLEAQREGRKVTAGWIYVDRNNGHNMSQVATYVVMKSSPERPSEPEEMPPSTRFVGACEALYRHFIETLPLWERVFGETLALPTRL